jgi:SAM-dependent methyltransferase
MKADAAPVTQRDQDRIWDYFQNEGLEVFRAAEPRLTFLERRLAQLRRDGAADILNIGIGSGFLEQKLLARGIPVLSLDPDARAVERMTALGARARVGYIQQMPFADASVDVVVASEVLEHLDEPTREGGLREIRRVLRPGGWFLGTVPADEDLSQNEVRCPCCGERFHRWGHQESFSSQSVRAMLEPQFEVPTLQRRAWVVLRRQPPLQIAKGLAWIVLVRVLRSRMGYPGIFFAARRPRSS